MFRPRLPPTLKMNGTMIPAGARLNVGGFLTGNRKTLNGQTLYVTVTDEVLPTVSVAVTLNVCEPSVVSIAWPGCFVPTQPPAAIPEPASWHDKSARIVSPARKTAPFTGVVSVIFGPVRSIGTTRNASLPSEPRASTVWTPSPETVKGPE